MTLVVSLLDRGLPAFYVLVRIHFELLLRLVISGSKSISKDMRAIKDRRFNVLIQYVFQITFTWKIVIHRILAV